MKQAKLERRLAKVHDLPTLPVVVNNVIQITQNPKSSALEVGRAISYDQALATKVLKTANSAFYGFPRKITTITHAIVILGFANIRNIVLTASIFDMFPSKGKNKYFDREGFWKHSLACGVTSKLIAKRLGIKNLEEAFICGLLHDLGKLVMDTHFNEDFGRVVRLVKEKEILIRDAEQQLLGIDHAAVGGVVADKWNLPPALIKAIRFHHNPPLANESMRIAAIVHLADALCRAIGMGNGGDGKVPCINEESWELLNLNKQTIKRLFSEMEEEVATADTSLPFVK
ncbi:MAG: HDOD domain-containing protein [Proteobacteria bacterium]|nr:HDOD domain-containing protein [Pseudomonadota bacterium]